MLLGLRSVLVTLCVACICGGVGAAHLVHSALAFGGADRIVAPARRPHDAVEHALVSLQYLHPFWDQGVDSGDTLSTLSDLEYEFRVEEMNRLSPIPMRYHPSVRRYIKIYTQDRRSQVVQMLSLADYYFPLFRQELDASQLPLELVYLSVVESALNPLALSPSGAVGLWQFKLHTGEMFDLHVDSFLDDRMDPLLSTKAACAYLRYLYKLFEDWPLALAAYNAGPGAVQRAIQRAGGERDYWKLLPHLPVAAQNYVPAFIAAAYVFRYAADHGLRAHSTQIDFRDVDTVLLSKATSFEAVAQWTGVPLHTLHFLNPRYKLGYVPRPTGVRYVLVLPTEAMGRFIEHESRIYAQSHKISETPFERNQRRSMRYHHVVQPGEYWHRIGLRYGCTPDELRGWNTSLRDLHPGDTLQVWLVPDQYAILSKQ